MLRLLSSITSISFYLYSGGCLNNSERPLVIFLVIGSHGIVNIIFRKGIIHRLSLTVKSRNQREGICKDFITGYTTFDGIDNQCENAPVPVMHFHLLTIFKDIQPPIIQTTVELPFLANSLASDNSGGVPLRPSFLRLFQRHTGRIMRCLVSYLSKFLISQTVQIGRASCRERV